jgi:hypothetical protein
VLFSNGNYQNPLEHLEENSNLGGVLFIVKGKAFETGEKFQIMKMLLTILFIHL